MCVCLTKGNPSLETSAHKIGIEQKIVCVGRDLTPNENIISTFVSQEMIKTNDSNATIPMRCDPLKMFNAFLSAFYFLFQKHSISYQNYINNKMHLCRIRIMKLYRKIIYFETALYLYWARVNWAKCRIKVWRTVEWMRWCCFFFSKIFQQVRRALFAQPHNSNAPLWAFFSLFLSVSISYSMDIHHFYKKIPNIQHHMSFWRESPLRRTARLFDSMRYSLLLSFSLLLTKCFFPFFFLIPLWFSLFCDHFFSHSLSVRYIKYNIVYVIACHI